MRHHRWVLGVWVSLSQACGGSNSPSLLDDTTIVYPVPDWQTAAPSELGFDESALTQLSTTADGSDSHCLVVTRKGRVVAEWYWDGWTQATEQVVFSVTKTFASTLIGIAQDEGKLNVEDAASKYISEWQGGASSTVKVRDLLSNDSGRQWTFIKDYLEMAGTAADKTAYAVALGQDHPPGTFWEYNNSGIQTLERVLKNATGAMDVAAYAHDKLFQPLGMASHMGHDSAGNTLLFEDLSASCRDLARFGYLFLRHGKWAGGQTVVSEAWTKAATTQSQPLNAAYGYLWWLNNNGHYVRPSAPARVEGEGKMIPGLSDSAYFALGLGAQMILIDPEHEIVMTRIGGESDPLKAFNAGGDPVGSAIVASLGSGLAASIKK